MRIKSYCTKMFNKACGSVNLKGLSVYQLEFIIITIVFVISPFMCFPLLLIGAYNRRKYAYVYISIFAGLLSMYYYPQGDQYRYMVDFLSYKNLEFSELFDYNAIITYRNFNLITLSLFGAAKCKFFTLELYRMILVSLSCGFVLMIYYKNSKYASLNEGRAFQFRLFLIILLSVPFYYVSQGFRSGFGAVIVFMGIYYCMHHKKIGYFLMLLACTIHYMYIPLSVLYLVAIKLRYRINNINFVLYFFLIISIISGTVFILYGRLPFVTFILDFYLWGEYGTGFRWDAYRVKEIVLINGIPTLLLYTLFLLSNKERTDYRISNIMYVNLAILVASLPFQAFVQRLCIISVLLLAFYCVTYYKSMQIRKYAQIIIVTLLISNIYPFFMHRYCYYQSNIENFFIYPLPLILQNTYDVSEANYLLDEQGVLKQQYLE